MRRARDVGDGAERVGRGADREQLRARCDRRLEVAPVEPAVLGAHLHHANGDAAVLLQRTPRRDVAVVIELGDDDFVALAPLPAERARQVEGERRHVLAERDLVGAAVQEIGKRFSRVGDQRVGLFARRIAPVRVGVVIEEVVVHRVARRRAAPACHPGRRRYATGNPLCVRSSAGNCARMSSTDATSRRRGIDHRRHAISTPAHCSTNFTIST